jgi:hypothetical protein
VVAFSLDGTGSVQSQTQPLSWTGNIAQLANYTFQIQQNEDSGQLQIVSLQNGDQGWTPITAIDVSNSFQTTVPSHLSGEAPNPSSPVIVVNP